MPPQIQGRITLGEPLVPEYADVQRALNCLEDLEAGIAGVEVELLLVAETICVRMLMGGSERGAELRMQNRTGLFTCRFN